MDRRLLCVRARAQGLRAGRICVLRRKRQEPAAHDKHRHERHTHQRALGRVPMSVKHTNLQRIIAVASVGVVLMTAAVRAHHAFSAEFDQNKPIQLEGAVTKADWTNPHAWIYIDVKGPDGTVVNWAIEMGPPSALLRRGWKKSSMQYGAIIKVEGFAAKNGKEFANATNITMPDGTKIFAGTDEPQR